MRIDSYTVSGWKGEGRDFADGQRPVGLRVFGCDAELD